MNQIIQNHIEEYSRGNSIWTNEISSQLASPLDSRILQGRKYQLQQLGVAPSFHAFQKALKGEMFDFNDIRNFFPYSNEAHEAATKVGVHCYMKGIEITDISLDQRCMQAPS